MREKHWVLSLFLVFVFSWLVASICCVITDKKGEERQKTKTIWYRGHYYFIVHDSLGCTCGKK